MGEGVQVGKPSQGGITDENVILDHFLCKLPRSSPCTVILIGHL